MHKKPSKSPKANKNLSNENTDSTFKKKAKRVKKNNPSDENQALMDLKNVKPSVFNLENNELIQSLDKIEFLNSSENHMTLENNNREQSLFSNMNLPDGLGILEQTQAQDNNNTQQKIQSNQIEYNNENGWENDISDDQMLEMSGLANVPINEGVVNGMIDCSNQKYDKSNIIDYFNFEHKGNLDC